MNKLRVFIVDDNFVARRGLRSVLEVAEDITVVGEASTGVEAIRCLDEIEVDITLMDIRMPGLSGVEATGAVLRAHPGARVLMMTVVEDPVILASAMMAGARGYLSYGHFTPEVLVDALRAVAAGRRVTVPPLPAAPNIQGPGLAALTQREAEILRLIATGRENREIAGALSIEEKTIKNHINNIYSKLGVQSRQEAIYYLLRVFLEREEQGADAGRAG